MISLDGVPQTSMDLIRIILIDQMCMKPERVNIYDEKWIIPPHENLFITIEYRNGKTIGNNNYFVNSADSGAPVECQVVNMLENIVVGVFSRNREATLRKEEVLMSIMSSYSEYIQESYGFKIARAGQIEDLSALEGTAMLKRYDIELNVYAWYKRLLIPGYIAPPFTLQVTVNDSGNGEIQRDITQFLTPPN